MSDEVLVKVENVSKKFCRSLKKSLWYGVQDIAGELFGRNDAKASLRPDEFWALKDVSFELRRGESLGLVGRNGAGKSTLLKLLNGLIKPDEGRISIRGRAGALIELGAGFNPILTGSENIYVNAAVLGIPKRKVDQIIDDIIDFAELHEFIDTPVQSYSSGMRVRLAFAVAAQMEPDILFIDEVLAVGDASFQSKCLERVQSMLDSGVACIFVSHNPAHVLRITQKAILLDSGHNISSGKTPDVLYKYTSSIGEVRYDIPESKRSTSFARIESVELVDSVNGEIDSGDDINIRIRFCSFFKGDNLRIGVQFSSRKGNPVMSCFTRPFGNIPYGKTVEVILSIEEAVLLPGDYYLSFGLGYGGPFEPRNEMTTIAGALKVTIKPFYKGKFFVESNPFSWGYILHDKYTIKTSF